jgi:hypothetical protein
MQVKQKIAATLIDTANNKYKIRRDSENHKGEIRVLLSLGKDIYFPFNFYRIWFMQFAVRNYFPKVVHSVQL